MKVQQKKFYIETFGCQMNVFDSERIICIMEKEGYVRTSDPECSEIILINTCSVREKAENKLFGHIGNLKSLKIKNPDLLICIGGCTAQNKSAEIINKFPYVDIVFGTANINKLPDLISERLLKNRSVCDTGDFPETFDYLYDFKRQYSFKALLPIMIGCNNYCSYCIVPFVRGRERSAGFDQIIKTAEKLAGEGVVEITLLGQNVNSYGQDLKTGHENFAKLLSGVSQIKALKRIRFMTSHPGDFNEDIIDVISENNNIMNHIHLPLQAGSDRILKKMNRRYTSADFKKIYYMIKEKIPDCAVTTDIIVGFPEEKEEDFLKTLKLVRELRFNRAFTFIYSTRKGTSAELLEDSVSADTKRLWFRNLLELQNKISLEENMKLAGKKLEVLVEGYSLKNNQLEGRLENNLIVNFRGDEEMIGKFIMLKITDAKSFYLKGKINE